MNDYKVQHKLELTNPQITAKESTIYFVAVSVKVDIIVNMLKCFSSALQKHLTLDLSLCAVKSKLYSQIR